LAATLEAIQLKLGRGLTPKEISDTRLHMKGLQQAGADIEVSCGACYVDSARIKIGLAVERFIRLFPDFAQHKEDLLFQRGLDKLKRDNPDVFTKFTSYIAPQNIKASESRTDYDSDILFLPQKLVDLFNIRSGLRWQSWSDFEVPHLIDAMQAVVDHAARGLKAHTYTKVPLMAELFGRTGIMMNMSLIPKGTGVNKDGSLDFDPVEGMPFDVAKELRNRKEHSNTVGTIAIGVTDENILAMMADPDIDFIIPYHKSGLPKIIADREGMEAWQDYTDSQNNKIGDKKLFAKSRFKDIDDFSDWDSTLAWWDVTKTGDENASVYLKTARDAGVKPKFAKFSNKPGYWKTLIDRKMFNNDGAQIIQQALKPVYDMELVNKTISEYQAPRSEADPQIVDDIANTMPKTLSNEEIKTGSHKTQSQHDLLLSKKKSDRSKSEEKRIAGIKDKIKNGVKAETLRSDGAAKKELTKPEQVGLAYLFDLHKAQQMYPGDYDRLMKLYTKAGGQFSFSSPAAGKAEEAEPAQADGEIQYSIRTKPAPKETKKAYKLFRKVGDAAHALFIGRSMPMKEGTWYDAQSPLIKDLEGLPVNKTYLIDKKGNAVTKRFANKQQAPNKKLINEAGLDGTRYVLIKEHKKTGERLYHNWGINGSGGVSTFAMRPGWHSTNVPSARHIGEQVDGKVAYRREDEQWAEIEVSADKDYNEEANSRASKDIPENIPEDGWYSFQTNTNANKAQDWFIGGSIKINRFLSDLEAQEISLADGYEADLPRKNATEVSEAPETSLKQLKEKHSGSIGTILISESGNDIKLASIIVQKDNRKQGVGTAFMNDLVALADSQGKRILLSPGQKDDKHGTSSRSRLVKFYKRFGFVENKGRNKDFQISEGMFRDPADDVSESPDTSKETGPVQETTLGEILNKAQTESVNEGVRKLSKLLGQFIPAEKLKIKVVIDPSARSSSFKSNKNTGFKQITIKSSLKHGVNLHEIVHAVTVLEMNSNPVLRQKVKHLMHQVKTDLIKNGVISKELLDAAAESKTSREFKSNFNGKIDKTVGDIVYAFLNEKEFLAQAFSSNKFQNLLNGIQVRDKGAMKSAWDAFVELVMKGLGINPKHDNAFSEAIKLVAELAGKEATTADTISLENMFSPDWYSRLQGTLQEKGSTQTADQWLKSISSWKKKGTLPAPVQEELEWSGLEDYLAGLGKEKVSREQLAKFVADNGVKLEEVVKQGGNPDGGNPDGDWEDATSEEILEAYMAMTGQTEDEVQWVTEGDMIVELNMELDPSNDAAKFVEYQLPGGKNYKELLITLPKKENTPERKKFESFIGKMETKYGDDWIDEITKAEEDERNILARDSANSQDLQFDSSHYEEANILAHIRFNERLDPDGKKVLFLEEIQSDWHQSGKKKGYKGDSAKFTEKWKDHVEKIEPYVSANNENIAGEDIANVVGDPLVLESIGVPEAIINEGLALVKEMNSDLSSVPNAPFKSTPAWTMLAMKRMIRYATENGFDKVAWTTGEQQAERYDLSKKISRVVYDPNDKTLFAYDLDSKQVMKERNVGEGQIEDHIGKEAARRLTSKENTNLKHESKGGGVNFYEIEGENLKVGGEGMKAFYDKMLPSNTQKFIKQFGGKVENFQVDVGSQDWVSGSMVMDSMGIPEKDQSAYWGNLEAEERDQLQDDYRKEISHSNQQGFSITPAMQESAGMPLFAPKSLEDDVSEAPPGEDSIEGIMSNLRKTATTKADLEKAGIAKEQEIIEQYRKLETLARDPHSSIASKQAMIASFLKVLPVNVRAKVITPLTFISRFLGIGTHTKRMDEALARAEKELVSYLSREIIAGIQKGITPKKLAKNRIKKDTIGPAAARDLQFIRDTLKEEDIEAIAVQVDAQILRKEDELEAATDKEALVIEDELSDLRSHRNIIETFGDLKTQNLEDLLFAKEALNSIVSEGRALWRAQQESFKAALGPVVAKVQQDISGQEDPTVESAAEATKRREKEDTVKGRAKKTWNAVENSILSWEFLMNKLSTLAGDKVLQSYTTKKMLSVAKKATDDEILYKDESDTTIHSKAMEIFNTKKDADLNELFMDQEIKQSGEVFAYGEMGKQLGDFTMSPMEAAYMYAVRKNPDSIPTFEGMHMTDKTFDEIEKFIGPELKAWVDYNVDEYLQDFHYDVNQVYRKVFGTNLSKTPGYISWYRDVPGKVQEKGIAASPSESGTKGMARGAFKERVKNTNPYRMMSFNDVLMKHVDEMNNFRAWAMPTKVINGVFNNRQTQRLITQHHGANLAKNIKQFQTDFTKSPTELRGDLPWLDQLRGNITTAMTALNPTIFLKQLTSIPALAESIPASAWAKNSALFWTNPLKAWNILKDSKTWEGRRQMGMERDIRTAQVVSGSQAIANVRNLKNRAMFLVKWGDGAAILVGGYPVYKYHFDKNLSEMGKAAAHKFALGKFEEAMDRTQQSSGIKDQGNIQRSGSYAKLFTMFITSPKQYTSQITAAIRGIHANPKDGDAYKRLFIFGVLMPSLFKATATGLLGIIGGDDDDKEEFVSGQIKAILTSPLNGIPIVRDLQNAVWESAVGEWYGTDVDYSPATQAGSSLMGAIYHGAKLLSSEEMTPEKKEKHQNLALKNLFETVGYRFGLPANTVRKMVLENWADVASGETDYPIRRSLGFSRYAMGEKASRYTRNKTKVEDATKRREDKEPREGDGNLLKLNGFLKDTETRVRRLKKLKGLAKTKESKDGYSEKIEKVRSQFNNRF
jgi:GNAT superfamily N-acetyltransferase